MTGAGVSTWVDVTTTPVTSVPSGSVTGQRHGFASISAASISFSRRPPARRAESPWLRTLSQSGIGVGHWAPASNCTRSPSCVHDSRRTPASTPVAPS